MEKVGAPVESSTGEPLASTIGLVGVGSSAGKETVGTVGFSSNNDWSSWAES